MTRRSTRTWRSAGRSDDVTAQQLKYLTPIETVRRDADLPVIPTVYGASFDEYSTAHFTGWPSASNPYESGSPNAPTNEVIVSAPEAGLLTQTGANAPLPGSPSGGAGAAAHA